MKETDVIAEVRATRDRLSERYGNVHELILALREMSRLAGRKTVSFPPRRPEGWIPPEQKKSAA